MEVPLNTPLLTPPLSLLTGSIKSATGSTPSAAERIGNELESMFASVLIKTMRESLTEEGLFPGDQSDALGTLFDQYMGEHIARGGGLGLARALQRSTQSAAMNIPPQVTNTDEPGHVG